MKKIKNEELTEKIIGAAYSVHNCLGFGFLEKVYQNALMVELEKVGLKAESERPVVVFYKDVVVGDYIADIVVENQIIVELKSMKMLNEAHRAQLVNYLRSTNMEVGLLVNFGDRVEVKRVLFDNVLKKDFDNSFFRHGKREQIKEKGFLGTDVTDGTDKENR